LPQASSILGLAIVIIVGYYGAKLIHKINFPAVTAYLLIGIIIGPNILNLVPLKIMDVSHLVSNFVLGIIAFSLGENFSIKAVRSAGKSVIWISVFEACCASLAVTLILILYYLCSNMSIYPAFILGAAAAATAPAATVMVIREYRAQGALTNMLLQVVAIDDAWCLILSALAITVANALHLGVFNPTVLLYLLLTIIGALTLGVICGFGLHYSSKFVRTREELLTVTLGFILLIVGLSVRLRLSPLLTALVSGLVITNISKNSSMFFEIVRNVDSILFLCFFVLVGTNLEVHIIPKIGFMGLLYVLFRVIGKFVGVKLGSLISGADEKIGKYLGWGLVPQAGVALGVALSARELFPKYGSLIFTTITATTVVYELVGPICAKFGLKKAGEI